MRASFFDKCIFRVLLVIAVLFNGYSARCQQIGKWSFSQKGLPVYQYTGALPFKALDKDGNDALQPEDPYFLLGNYKLALFAHASGTYQLITAERAWGRVNAAERPNYGWNEASIAVNAGSSKKVILTGVNSLAANQRLTEKYFGVGFARYSYKLDDALTCTRIISVKPSAKINTGNSCFVLTIILKNNGKFRREVTYSERTVANFVLNSTQYINKLNRPLIHHANINIDEAKEIALANFETKANKFLVLPAKNERFVYDIAPPSMFMYAKGLAGSYTSKIAV
ncbi:MAG: hypothetical protein H7X88_12655, partial [Gloeobacteraceae cyanobacterium ES-bin-316]|nr:hypothetical protein [Ferruginibacter sp.]